MIIAVAKHILMVSQILILYSMALASSALVSGASELHIRDG